MRPTLKLGAGFKGNANLFCDYSFYYFYNFLFFYKNYLYSLYFAFDLEMAWSLQNVTKVLIKFERDRPRIIP